LTMLIRRHNQADDDLSTDIERRTGGAPGHVQPALALAKPTVAQEPANTGATEGSHAYGLGVGPFVRAGLGVRFP
jgi:hypothetical protein